MRSGTEGSSHRAWVSVSKSPSVGRCIRAHRGVPGPPAPHAGAAPAVRILTATAKARSWGSGRQTGVHRLPQEPPARAHAPVVA